MSDVVAIAKALDQLHTWLVSLEGGPIDLHDVLDAQDVVREIEAEIARLNECHARVEELEAENADLREHRVFIHPPDTEAERLLRVAEAEIARLDARSVQRDDEDSVCHDAAVKQAERIAALEAEIARLQQEKDEQVVPRVRAILTERQDDLTKQACDECEQCGQLVMCNYHSLLSELAGHVTLPLSLPVRVKEYLQHKPTCSLRKPKRYRRSAYLKEAENGELVTVQDDTLIDGPGEHCTCGLASLLAVLDAPPQTAQKAD